MLIALTACLAMGMDRQSLPNLALSAKATAFEFFEEYRPENANDGKLDTRWSGIPGHNSGAWYALEWPKPVQVGEIIVHQYDRFTRELDVQIWDSAKNDWRTLKHYGKPNLRLHGTVIYRTEPVQTTKVRIANATFGPSFREVEVYSEAFANYKPEVHAASDLRGNIVGVVTDPWGAEPVAGATVLVEIEKGRSRTVDPGTLLAQVANTDRNGMFSVPMVIGMKGKVLFTVTNSNFKELRRAKESHEVDAADFQYGLTELGYKPKVTLLDGTWKFMGDAPAGFEKAPFDDSAWKDIKVPAHWEMEGFVVRSGHGGYRKKFVVPRVPSPLEGEGLRAERAGVRGLSAPSPLTRFADSPTSPSRGEVILSRPPAGHRLKIRFDGVYSAATVYCNGTLVARHTGGATPFEADLTEAVKEGENVLAVDVQEHTVASENLDKMSKYAYFHLAGIWRSAYLFEVPNTRIHVPEWTTSQSHDPGITILELQAYTLVEERKPFQGKLRVSLTDPSGKAVELGKEAESAVDSGAYRSSLTRFRIPIREPKPWNAEQPNLYRLRLELLDSKAQVIHRIDQRLGFRETKIKGTEILINNTPVKFKGVCHHDQHPLKGRAVSEEDTRRDLELMKEANLNAVRTSHYPPHPSLPEIADELGLYVEAEAPFCWADCSQDARHAPLILQLTAETIQRDRNHPSVAWWSLANESEYGWGFERAREWAKKADPSRPHSAATSADLDIATLHNPIAISRIEDAEKRYTKPLIFDESFCIFQGIFGDVAELWVDPGIRDYYIEPLKPIYEAFMKSKVTQGSFIWAWSDDIFCVPNRGLEYGRETTRSHFLESSYLVPGRGLVGDAPWGVVDGWRRKKPEFWHVKMLHSPVKVLVDELPIPKEGEPIRIPVENQSNFTDLKDVTFQWMIGGVQSTVQGSGAPHSRGEIVIDLNAVPISLKPGDSVYIFEAFEGEPGGYWEIPFSFASGATRPETPKRAKLQVFRGSDLSGSSFVISGSGFELSFSRDTGLLRSATASGKVLLLEAPTAHLLPTNSPLNPLPNLRSWRLEAFDTRLVGDSVEAVVSASFGDLTSVLTYLVSPEGTLTVSSMVTYQGPDLWLREAGLRFSVPLECDLLNWHRKGDWTFYDSGSMGHIGRISGEARPFPTLLYGRPQAPVQLEPYGWDYSPLGSNDFRSTKRRIESASIGYPRRTRETWIVSKPDQELTPEGPRIEILSDGTQHLRAMVEPDRISVHVNDFYGGTNAGWWEWEHNYGKGKLIKKGDVLKSKLVLRLVGG